MGYSPWGRKVDRTERLSMHARTVGKTTYQGILSEPQHHPPPSEEGRARPTVSISQTRKMG